MPAGTPTTNITFTVGSVEVSTKNLTVSATSVNTSLIPSSNIILGGSGPNRTIQLTPVGVTTGSSLITVSVNDGQSTTSTTFTLSVTAPAVSLFANASPISITGNTTNSGSAPYPSSIAVSGLLGNVSKVSVVLQGLSHNNPQNLDVLLVSPNGTAVMLISGVGGTNAISASSPVRLVLDDSGALLSQNTVLVSGTNHPAFFNTTDVLVGPAPAGPYVGRLSAFAGGTPNGTWSLYVSDRVTGDVGQISQGWALQISTAPIIQLTSAVPITLAENSSAGVTFEIFDPLSDPVNLSVVANSSNPTLLPPQNVAFTKVGTVNTAVGSTNTYLATITPAQLQNGSNNLTLTVIRNDGANSSVAVPMTVTPINVPPTISRLVAQQVNENSSEIRRVFWSPTRYSPSLRTQRRGQRHGQQQSEFDCEQQSNLCRIRDQCLERIALQQSAQYQRSQTEHCAKSVPIWDSYDQHYGDRCRGQCGNKHRDQFVHLVRQSV